jgi:hypothetical protein
LLLCYKLSIFAETKKGGAPFFVANLKLTASGSNFKYNSLEWRNSVTQGQLKENLSLSLSLSVSVSVFSVSVSVIEFSRLFFLNKHDI